MMQIWNSIIWIWQVIRMWNIMKSQNYQTRGDNLVIYGFLIVLIFPFLGLLMDGDGSIFGDLNGGMYLLLASPMFPFAATILSLIVVARICGWDSTDKTINYEIMAGHSKAEVYFGRVCSALIWTIGGSFAAMVLPVAIISLICGFGNSMPLGDVALHTGIFLAVVFRMSCEYILLTFLLRNCYAAMLLGYTFTAFGMVGVMIYTDITGVEPTVETVLVNMGQLFNFGNYQIKNIGGEEIQVFNLSLEPSIISSTVLVSLLVGIICLLVGYVFFSRRDMR